MEKKPMGEELVRACQMACRRKADGTISMKFKNSAFTALWNELLGIVASGPAPSNSRPVVPGHGDCPAENVQGLPVYMAAYEGKALVNSVTAEDERMEMILPLVKKYGAAVIALPNDDKEIPEDPQRRFELTEYIVEKATGTYGIPIEDIVIDPLAMPIGADSQMVVRTLETIHLIADRIGVNMTLGASNVSFGMPDRHTLNSVFLPMAMGAGLTSAIMDARTPSIVTAVKAGDLMLGNDEWGMAWISAHRAREAAQGT